MLDAAVPGKSRDAFRALWEAYENFLDGFPVLGESIRKRNVAFEDLLRERGLFARFVEQVTRLPAAGRLADLEPRIFSEDCFQRTGKKRTDEHSAYASDYEHIRSGCRPKEPLARLLNLLYVIRNNLQHGQKVLPEEWSEMRRRNLEVFCLVAPV